MSSSGIVCERLHYHVRSGYNMLICVWLCYDMWCGVCCCSVVLCVCDVVWCGAVLCWLFGVGGCVALFCVVRFLVVMYGYRLFCYGMLVLWCVGFLLSIR